MTEKEKVEVLHVLLNMFFFKFLILKFKPSRIEIFYRLPNANDFLNTFWNGL